MHRPVSRLRCTQRTFPRSPLGERIPIAYVTRLAREKAEAVFRCADCCQKTAAREEEPDGSSRSLLLGADTTVTLDDAILGKPEDAADAARMLRLLSGPNAPRHYRRGPGDRQTTEVAAEATAVRLLTLSDEEIAAYVATGEPMDKAGAYAIQGQAARWIPRIEGCYFNVVGLPLALVSALLEDYWPRIDRIQRHGLVDHGCIK